MDFIYQSPEHRHAKVTPGQSRFITLHHIFEYNLEKAYDECMGVTDADEHHHLLLTRLAIHCLETGIPMAIAKRMTRYRAYGIGDDDLLIDKVFGNVYRPTLVKRYEERSGYRPEKNIPPETLLTMKIDIFLNENYEIRKNVMRGVAEFRERTGIGFSYRDLTEEARNSITMRALMQGIKCWDKDIRRYVNSEDIDLYDPLSEYLEGLPKWDGKDRVTPLALRVPNDCAEWPELFHLWMRSMVAMWLGRGQLTGKIEEFDDGTDWSPIITDAHVKWDGTKFTADGSKLLEGTNLHSGVSLKIRYPISGGTLVTREVAGSSDLNGQGILDGTFYYYIGSFEYIPISTERPVATSGSIIPITLIYETKCGTSAAEITVNYDTLP